MGVRCSIDDFGTGYSGLTYLSQLPIYSLKIDQSFIQKIGSSLSGDRIVDAVITLARSLDMRVIAEGVETNNQAAFLFSHGCDEMQGFLFCPPLPARALDELLKTRGEPPSPTYQTHPARFTIIAPKTETMKPDDIATLLQAFCTNQSIAEIDETSIAAILAALGPREPPLTKPSGHRHTPRRLNTRTPKRRVPPPSTPPTTKSLPILAQENSTPYA